MLQIAVDGPAGSGKSTVSKKISDKLNILYLDTGAMYRVAAHFALKYQLDDVSLVREMKKIDILFEKKDDTQKVFYSLGEKKYDVTDEIRSVEVSAKVPLVSKIPEIRKIMTKKQQEIADKSSVIMDGRDIGTVVLPNADFKFFLTASPEVRARRRFDELKSKNKSITYDEILSDILKRDKEDENRIIAPLKAADDAVFIDTSEMDIDDVVGNILSRLNKNKIEIYLADNAGFCFGVERAVRLVDETSQKSKNVHTLGPIIHNPQLVKKMENKGIGVKYSVGDVSKDDTIVIRSHGVSKSDIQRLSNLEVELVDATCPFVSRAQKEAEKLSEDGYFLVIFGEKDHPEVKGIVSYAAGDFVVIENEQQAAELDFYKDKIGFIAQTTQNKVFFDRISSILQKKCRDLKIINTICNATTHRQESAKIIASKVDVMFVVGGKNSGNTTRLYEICKKICPKTFHIETKDYIDKEQLIGVKKAGITAGASTPQYLIDEVIKFLEEVENAGK